MPTGYTATLHDGEQSFEDYAWGIARAFGALIMMRDAPKDAPIPETFGADTGYYDNQIAAAREDLRTLTTVSVEEAGRRAQEEHHESLQCADRERARRGAIRVRYEEMLARAEAYEPPTADHVHFKEMMVSQLREAIDFDCGMEYWPTTPLRTPQEWVENQRERAERDLANGVKRREEEIERARGRTAWVQALRESLKGES